MEENVFGPLSAAHAVLQATYIPRAIEPVIRSISQEYPALLLTGPRQVGKTTMLRHLMAGTGRTYLSLDDLDIRKSANEDPKRFLARYEPPLLIDEIQYAPGLFTYLKIMVDERQVPGDFWMTGSQTFKLMRGIQESMAGRVAHIRLSSLSQAEVEGFESVPFTVDRKRLEERQAAQEGHRAMGRQVVGGSHQTFAETGQPSSGVFERIFVGGMPALVSGRYRNSTLFFSSYLDSYIERDVRDLVPGLDSFRFLDFIRSMAARTARVVNYAALARDAGISEKTAKAWLSLLETLGVVRLLYPYSNNALNRTLKSPKAYFFDTGFAAHLAGFRNGRALEDDRLSGAFFENHVMNEIVRSYYNAAESTPLYYYADARQNEIDLILDLSNTLYPIEIKQSVDPGIRSIASFKVLDKTGRRGPGAVVCRTARLGEYNVNDLIVPVGLI
jgi:predicted AAA+ superfamily ATPase